MRIGQTSVIVFISKVLGSTLGFVATLYFARFLGAEVVGLFALVMTLVNWFVIGADLGIGGAMIKRISEGDEQGEFLSAAIIWNAAIGVVVSIGLIFAQSHVENYVGEFDQYVTISVVWFIIGILAIRLFVQIVGRILSGQRMVHIRGLLQPVNIGLTSLTQIGLVLIGFGLLGMLFGWMVGSILVGLIGLYWVQIRPARPAKRHFTSLFNYAKFSWLGKLKSRAFNDVDILLLGVFVPTSLVGVYSVAWSISTFLELFGRSISGTLFPEISHKSAQESKQAVAGLVEDALAYTGLIAIPGLVGGLILAKRLLQLYGDEFTQGSVVLGLFILATLFYSYQQQLMNALNGIDHPDIAFRINVTFIAVNAVLNVILIPQFGIEGGAVATAFSAVVGLVLSYYALDRVIDFRVPVSEPARQIAAALLMGGVVWGALAWIEATGAIGYNAIIVVSLVSLGAGVYFLTLLVISTEFRATVNRNLPVEVPFFG